MEHETRCPICRKHNYSSTVCWIVHTSVDDAKSTIKTAGLDELVAARSHMTEAKDSRVTLLKMINSAIKRRL
jgi:hypothetical protein